MKQTILAGAFALVCLGYISCQSPSTSTPSATAAAATDSTVAANPHGGGGQRVPSSEIGPCLAAYDSVMKAYGITPDSPSKPVGKCPTMTYRSTITESLTYTSFRNWLDSSVNALDPIGKGANLNLTIAPGICTAKFVADLGAPAGRTGRISYFVTLTKIDTTGAPGAKPMGGGDGYEIGGLEP